MKNDCEWVLMIKYIKLFINDCSYKFKWDYIWDSYIEMWIF